MRASFQTTSEMNKNGIAALVIGRHSDAIRYFGCALQLLKSELSKSTQDCAKSQATGVWKSSSSGRLDECIDTLKIPSMEPSADVMIPIFNQAIHVGMADPELGNLEPNGLGKCMYTAVVLFNYALALHSWALSSSWGKLRSESVLKASKLYGKVLMLLDDSNLLNYKAAVIAKLASIINLSQLSSPPFSHDHLETIVSENVQHQISRVVTRRTLTQAIKLSNDGRIQELLNHVVLLFTFKAVPGEIVTAVAA